MTESADWVAAFPLRPLMDAVEALYESWSILAASHRTHFHPGKREPELTRVLKGHVEHVTAPRHGLLGMWTAENVINRIDFDTGEICEERRTDIVYGWNNKRVGVQLVFEFKKLGRLASSRANYLGNNGLLRFVTGIYGANQPAAFMVGILTDQFTDCVPPLRRAISDIPSGPPLSLRRRAGEALDKPSHLSPRADFDTEHDRQAGAAAAVVRVSHIFLEFNYRPRASSAKRRAKTRATAA